MPNVAAPMSATVNQPQPRASGELRQRPISDLSDAMRTMTTMIGTAATPLRIAYQKSARIASMRNRFIAMPTRMPKAMTP